MQSIELRSDAHAEELDLIIQMVEETRGVPGDIFEIGSWKCGTSGVMAAKAPDRLVYAFDMFGGMPPGIKGPPWDFFDGTTWEEIVATAANFPNMRLVRGPHEETVPAFAYFKRPISLMLMDSDHYASHKISLEWLAPLVSREGVIMFHDWMFDEVQRAVSEEINPEEWKILTGCDTQRMGFLRKT